MSISAQERLLTGISQSLRGRKAISSIAVMHCCDQTLIKITESVLLGTLLGCKLSSDGHPLIPVTDFGGVCTYAPTQQREFAIRITISSTTYVEVYPRSKALNDLS